MKIRTLVTFIVVATLAASALAECRKSWICDDRGNNCSVRDICDSNIDLPSVGIAPLRPLPSMDLKPLPYVGLPPLGTTKCDYMQVNGSWQNICR